jgi:nondiscriminating aspartyl-tRNA synthetase
VQAEVVRLFADYLRGQGFTEIKTTKIVSSGTEGGTNIFELKYFDRAAYLAQSPQFYKQTMVGSGLERVFEINPVFRAEHHDTVRHLNEYTSLDFEMGFIRNEQEIIDMQEGLLRQLFAGVADRFGGELAEMGVEIRFPDAIPRIPLPGGSRHPPLARGQGHGGRRYLPRRKKALCEYFQGEGRFRARIRHRIPRQEAAHVHDAGRTPAGYTRSFDLLYRGLEITTGGQRIHDYHRLKENIVEFGHNPETSRTTSPSSSTACRRTEALEWVSNGLP